MATMQRQATGQDRRVMLAGLVGCVTLIVGGTGGYVLRAATTHTATTAAPAQAAPATHAFQPAPAPDTIDRASQAAPARPGVGPDVLDHQLRTG
jgi:hypothetical protein